MYQFEIAGFEPKTDATARHSKSPLFDREITHEIKCIARQNSIAFGQSIPHLRQTLPLLAAKMGGGIFMDDVETTVRKFHESW